MNSNTNNFCVIPVIDIMGGVVVRAERGERQNYRPIVSSLCASTQPLDIALALLRLYPFDTFYIADLDAIMGVGDNLQTVKLLRAEFPAIDFWLDAGVSNISQLNVVQHLGLTCVIGSERLMSLQQYQQLSTHETVLSLDFAKSGFLGDAALLKHPELWPQRVICMTLAHVGSFAGLDLAQLKTVQEKSNQIYAAGGTRNIKDLRTLADHKLAGALVASALHDGHITHTDLKQMLTA